MKRVPIQHLPQQQPTKETSGSHHGPESRCAQFHAHGGRLGRRGCAPSGVSSGASGCASGRASGCACRGRRRRDVRSAFGSRPAASRAGGSSCVGSHGRGSSRGGRGRARDRGGARGHSGSRSRGRGRRRRRSSSGCGGSGRRGASGAAVDRPRDEPDQSVVPARDTGAAGGAREDAARPPGGEDGGQNRVGDRGPPGARQGEKRGVATIDRSISSSRADGRPGSRFARSSGSRATDMIVVTPFRLFRYTPPVALRRHTFPSPGCGGCRRVLL